MPALASPDPSAARRWRVLAVRAGRCALCVLYHRELRQLTVAPVSMRRVAGWPSINTMSKRV